MLFSYNWLQSLIKEKLPKPKKLAELLTMHSFEVEEVKRRMELVSFLQEGDCEKTADSFLRDCYITCNVSGSRKGFQQHIQRSSFVNTKESFSGTKGKMSGFFNSKKREDIF